MLGDASTVKDLDLALNFVLDQMLTIEQLMINIILHFEAIVDREPKQEKVEVKMLVDVVKKFKSRPVSEQSDLEIYKIYKEEFQEVLFKTRGSVLKTEDKLKTYLGGQRHEIELNKVLTSFRDIMETIYGKEDKFFVRPYEFEHLRMAATRSTKLKRTKYFNIMEDGDDFMKYPRISLEEFVDIRKGIFNDLKKKIPEHLNDPSTKQGDHWFTTAMNYHKIKQLTDHYLELE